jgi:hypothetical protein
MVDGLMWSLSRVMAGNGRVLTVVSVLDGICVYDCELSFIAVDRHMFIFTYCVHELMTLDLEIIL